MSAATLKSIEGQAKQHSVQINQGFVAGRLGARRTMNFKEGKRYLQLLMTPAPDPYSMPSVVELKSTASLGAEGDDWSGYVRIGGYPNNYEATNKDGEIQQVRSARITLEVVEG